MRYLAIDWGQRRIGLAVGSDVTGAAAPLAVVHGSANPDETLTRVLAHIDEQGPDALVIGLPLNMDGSEGAAAKTVRAWAAALADKVKLPMHFQDERLSSAAADAALANTGRTRGDKRNLRDALAAATILTDFLS
jgi:putative Holliday junction resolvase